jgi:hypothetical protein
MNEAEIRRELAVRNAILNQFHSCGMRPLQGTEPQLEDWFKSKGCKLSADNGYLVIEQADGSAAVPSSACETLRRELPHLFVADPRRDEISSLADFRGTQTEILKAKAAYIRQHGLAAYTFLDSGRGFRGCFRGYFRDGRGADTRINTGFNKVPPLLLTL